MKKAIYISYLIAAGVFSGCTSVDDNPEQQEANQQTVAQLSDRIDELKYQLDILKRASINQQKATDEKMKTLEAEVATIFASSAVAYDEAIKANSRLDNIPQSFSK